VVYDHSGSSATQSENLIVQDRVPSMSRLVVQDRALVTMEYDRSRSSAAQGEISIVQDRVLFAVKYDRSGSSAAQSEILIVRNRGAFCGGM